MTAIRKQRAALVFLMLTAIGIAVGLVLFALGENINHFYTPSQILQGEAPKDIRIRGGGMVVAGSIHRDPDSLKVVFRVSDGPSSVAVEYEGILPDLFVEDSGVVVTGTLGKNGVIKASELLARHDSNYMPPEVKKALEKVHKDSVPGHLSATVVKDSAPLKAGF
ncbi:cytochrome c maturation protein CcmE [Endozoicomonas sp. OPT23]|uniref:cytochrome c maturation protein CcmE n=1 Tax=Endozoicomonas sp. OPT23 TaxID=2072845 RepID=UPI00129BD2D3|nr:cytochrome c maturation protein CcmE [Endozoicomonas sp. OPT23]MRI32358.1 cytochrome c maturation protein CcmE [Endozoicomonas sp. OPT23]